MDSDFIKALKRSKKTAMVLVSVLVFGGLLIYVLFLADTGSSATPVTAISTDATYQEYRDYISDTNKGVKALLDGDQLKQIKLYDQEAINTDVPRSDNPFSQTF